MSFEPRVRITTILLDSTGFNNLHVTVNYGIVGVEEPQEVQVILERVR